MLLFLDTVNIENIRHGAKLGVISGVTTNPSLMAIAAAKAGAHLATIPHKVPMQMLQHPLTDVRTSASLTTGKASTVAQKASFWGLDKGDIISQKQICPCVFSINGFKNSTFFTLGLINEHC